MTETVDRLFRRMKGDECNGEEPPDYLLLQTPQDKLEKPLLIESKILGERLYLCANEEQTQEIEAGGGVCYLPGEIRALFTKVNEMDGEGLKSYLNQIHAVKKAFLRSRIQNS